MAANKHASATRLRSDGAPPGLDCVAAVRSGPRSRSRHYVERLARRQRVLTITALLAVLISASFAIVAFLTGTAAANWWVGSVNVGAAVIFAVIPLLNRFGELVAPLTFIGTAYVSVFTVSWETGTGAGSQFFLLVGACLVVLLLGIEHIALAVALAAVAAGLIIALEFLVPRNTGLQPDWVLSLNFVLTTVSACVIAVATMWYALREVRRAEAVMEMEYDRSEALLANILPASIAARLKNPAPGVIADKYDDASVLFADIAGFTERVADTPPEMLIRFLDRLYTEFDTLVDRYGLEKIKVSGDSYMVVSGVPQPRPDHVEALADLALDIAATAATLTDPHGNTVPLRIGLASGPVVAGVVGSRRFFYDVWGDAVNVASRMESTDAVGRIQVPETVYQRLKSDFVLEERGEVNVKGKGVVRTWYLVGRKPAAGSGEAHTEATQQATL
jgi:adenylate cyclase